MASKKTVVREVEREDISKGINETRPKPGSNRSIPVIEEQIKIGKKVVEKEKYQIKKTVSQEDFSEDVPTTHEHVEIRRVEVNKYIDTMPDVRKEGNTTIIPVVKEVVVVEKKLVLVEEIHVTKSREEVVVNVKDKIRKEHIEISKAGNDQTKHQ